MPASIAAPFANMATVIAPDSAQAQAALAPAATQEAATPLSIADHQLSFYSQITTGMWIMFVVIGIILAYLAYKYLLK